MNNRGFFPALYSPLIETPESNARDSLGADNIISVTQDQKRILLQTHYGALLANRISMFKKLKGNVAQKTGKECVVVSHSTFTDRVNHHRSAVRSTILPPSSTHVIRKKNSPALWNDKNTARESLPTVPGGSLSLRLQWWYLNCILCGRCEFSANEAYCNGKTKILGHGRINYEYR